MTTFKIIAFYERDNSPCGDPWTVKDGFASHEEAEKFMADNGAPAKSNRFDWRVEYPGNIWRVYVVIPDRTPPTAANVVRQA